MHKSKSKCSMMSDCAALSSPHCALIHCVIFIQITNLYRVASEILYHHNHYRYYYN